MHAKLTLFVILLLSLSLSFSLSLSLSLSSLQTSKSNEMLSGLRYFEHALKDNGRGKPKPAFSWGAVDMGSVARCFQQLCAKAVDVFRSEPRLLELNSPSYVLGKPHVYMYIYMYMYVYIKA